MDGDRRALLLGLAAVFLWSTVATAFKIALRYLDVFQLLLIASTVSAVTLLLVVLYRRQGHLLFAYLRDTPGYFLAVALLNPCIFYLVLFTAYDLLPAQQAQAINYTWAITLALMAVPLLGQNCMPAICWRPWSATAGCWSSRPAGILSACSSTAAGEWRWPC